MPKRMIEDDRPLRGRKRALAMTPGLLMRVVMHSPRDFFAGAIAFAAICAIVGNAIFLQAGRHPSPLFGTPSFASATSPMVPNPLPRPRPIEATQPIDRPLDSRLFDGKPVETRTAPRADVKPDPRPEPKTEARAPDPMANLIRNASVSRPAAAANPNVPRPPAPVQSRGDPVGDLISGRGTR